MSPAQGSFFVPVRRDATMFDERTSCVVVVGAQWGDEGKGKLVDVLAERADFVVRYQGGANAGHTVVTGDSQFILRQIPSGILHPQATCLIGNGVVLDPETMFSELDALAERGIGPAYQDKTGRRGVRVGDLRDLAAVRRMLADRIARANLMLGMMGSAATASLDETMALLERFAPRLLSVAADTGLLVHRAVTAHRRVLLEGAQGALLDLDHGTYPFVTSSNTTAGGAAVGAGIGPTAIDGVLGVVKAYTTRVGNGPLPSAAEPADDERLRSLGGEFGAVTGRPRRCGWFDANVVRYAVRVNGLTDLAVTKLDVLDTFAAIPVCVAYEVDGSRSDEFPAEVERLERVRPVYETLPGWEASTAGARTLADLPGAARAYLDRLESLAGAPIRYVSVGTRRDPIIDV